MQLELSFRKTIRVVDVSKHFVWEEENPKGERWMRSKMILHEDYKTFLPIAYYAKKRNERFKNK